MQVFGKTDRGKTREINQDSFVCKTLSEDILILCVCDGMGGTQGGHIASKYAVRQFVHEISSKINIDMSDIQVKEMLDEAVLAANSFVYDMAVCDVKLKDMGTTLVGGVVIRDTAYISNVGDSRCYHIDKNNIIKITKDHSFVQQLIDIGKITCEESLYHPEKNIITKAIGISKRVTSDIFKIKLEQDDYIVLCSDGLHNLVSENLIKDEVLSYKKLDEKCERLISLANENGGLDNITVIILKFRGI